MKGRYPPRLFQQSCFSIADLHRLINAETPVIIKEKQAFFSSPCRGCRSKGAVLTWLFSVFVAPPVSSNVSGVSRLGFIYKNPAGLFCIIICVFSVPSFLSLSVSTRLSERGGMQASC